jgi:hypothetical protein
MRIFYVLRTQTGKTTDFNKEYALWTSQTSHSSFNYKEINDDLSKSNKGL